MTISVEHSGTLFNEHSSLYTCTCFQENSIDRRYIQRCEYEKYNFYFSRKILIYPAVSLLNIIIIIASRVPSSDGGQTGQWSTDGCKVIGRRTVDDHDYVTCECSHLTSFGVLMDRSNIEVFTHLDIATGTVNGYISYLAYVLI